MFVDLAEKNNLDNFDHFCSISFFLTDTMNKSDVVLQRKFCIPLSHFQLLLMQDESIHVRYVTGMNEKC